MTASNGSGQKLGEYELQEVVGRGGMAVVYRAHQPRIDRDVAVKVIVPPYSQYPKLVQRFTEEARAVARLQHPHILPVLDVGMEVDQPYMVMAYLAGGTLTRRIASTEAGMSLFDTICIIEDVAAALDYAHTQGIIHRDVKPGNILLDVQDHAYLSDFGVALLAAAGSEREAQTPGTYAYMAPEVALGASASRASDIYSLGVVIFEMLARRRPFDVREKDELLAALEDAAPDLMSFRPDLPPGVRVVVNQALSHAPESRPARASALALALSRAAGLDRAPCPPKRAEPLAIRRPVIVASPEPGVETVIEPPPTPPKPEPLTPPPESDPHTPPEVFPAPLTKGEAPPAVEPASPEPRLPRPVLPPEIEPPPSGPPTRPSLSTAAVTPSSLEGATPVHLDAVKESRQPAQWLYVLSVLALLVVILIVVVVLISLWTSPSSDFLGLPPLLR